MKRIHGGKVYDTDTMEEIAEEGDYINGKYCGRRWLGRTPQGKLAIVQTSNGQDLYRKSWIRPVSSEEARGEIEGWEINEGEATRLNTLGITTEA